MPIFMDRHDLTGLTAEGIAAAHVTDLGIQDRYGVRYITYWYDPERHTGFCLVDAPDAATAARVHREGHGEIATEIIPVDLAAVEAFLGRIGDPRHACGGTDPLEMGRGLRAIMFTDIVGSTEMTERLGDEAALELVRVHDSLVRRGLAAHNGRKVKHTGDGIMASFEGASAAVRAASEIQRHFADYNAAATESLRVRIGIHAGEPVEEHNDLFGATVQLAHRLCSEAEADGIIVSGLVRKLCEENTTRFVALGDRRLKGFAEPMPVFRFEWRDRASGQERTTPAWRSVCRAGGG